MAEARVDSFERLRGFLGGRGEVSAQDFQDEACHRRLVEAVTALRAWNATSPAPVGVPGAADLASLVRHVLRREQERQEGISQSLVVPSGGAWPGRDEWEHFGLHASDAGPGQLRVRAVPWRPEWLTARASPEKELFAEQARRTYTSEPGDPVLSIAGRSAYRSQAQREALRSALCAPPGSTLVVSLPTGAGKSLLAQAPALWFSRDAGVSVVVVPTTALCIDQERALGGLVEHPTAYYSGTDVEARERNQGIRQRLRDGTQRLVFTSPESLLGSLNGALYDAAREGHLRLLVADEAHMIDQWGDEFRSAFQEVAGLRRGLLQACPPGASFPTLLLTATLTESCLDTLETLFKEPGAWGITASVQLRPEPSFHFVRCDDAEEKQERLLEAVRHLPRPLILYTTKVAEARDWTVRLRAAGFRRCEEVTGETGHAERRRILLQWQRGETDVVVATSAFGLGVDKEDVRAVLHACVPENVDRYYQEVGRGGRDGRASLSLVVYTNEDVAGAQHMSQRKLIGIERGLERWKSMFDHSEPLGGGLHRVPLDHSPTFKGNDIDMGERSYHLEWNVRTLTLMARAGLVRLVSEEPPRLAPEDMGSVDAEAWYAQAFARHARRRLVQILDEDHTRPEAWTGAVESIRQRTARRARRGHELMLECLAGTRCVAEILAEVYRVGGQDSRQGIDVALACGGCAACRQTGLQRTPTPAPLPRFPWPRMREVGAGLKPLLGAGGLLAIYYEDPERDAKRWRHLHRAFHWFVREGLRAFAAPRDVLDDCRDDFIKGRHLVFFQELEALRFGTIPEMPLLLFHPPRRPIPPRMYVPSVTPGAAPLPPRVVFLPHDAVDPGAPYRRLRDVLDCRHLLFDEFRARVSP